MNISLWLFVLFFKFGGALHYTLLSPLGETILPVWVVGLIVGGASLLQLVLDVPAGILLDRFGYVRLMRLATISFVAAGAVFAIFGITASAYIASIVLATVGWLFFGPGVYSYLLVEAPKEHAGKYIGLFHVFDSLGVVAATAALTLVLSFPASWIGWTIALLLAVAVVSAFGIPKEHHTPPREQKISAQSYYVRRHFLHHVMKALGKLNPASTMLALHSFSSSAFYGTIWFVVPLVIARGTHEGLLGVSLGVFDLSIVLLGSLFGYLADKLDKRAMVFFGLLLFALAGMLLGFNFNLWFLLLGFLATSGDEFANVALWAWLDRLDTNHAEDGLVNGAITFFEDLGWTVGPMLAGALFGVVGPSWTIAASALLLFATWGISSVMLWWQGSPLWVSSVTWPRRARHKS